MTAEWLVDAPDGEAAAGIVLAPGAAGGIASAQWAAFAAALAEESILAIRFELPYRLAGRKSPPRAELSVPGYVEAFERAKAEHPSVKDWFAGGRSYGGRVGSLAVAGGMEARGLVFLSYPLHAPGRRDRLRTDHWPEIRVPCLFIQGTKDNFADLDLLEQSLPTLGAEYGSCLVEGGDHGLRGVDMGPLGRKAGRWMGGQKLS